MAHRIDRPKLAKCADCACFNLRKATRAVTQFYDEILRPSGIRATQFSLLVATSLLEPITVSRLSKMGVMDRTTLTRNLKPLEKQGLIRILPGDDRRKRVVTLTESGKEALSRAIPLWEKAQSRVVKALGQERWNSMLSNLKEIASVKQEA